MINETMKQSLNYIDCCVSFSSKSNSTTQFILEENTSKHDAQNTHKKVALSESFPWDYLDKTQEKASFSTSNYQVIYLGGCATAASQPATYRRCSFFRMSSRRRSAASSYLLSSSTAPLLTVVGKNQVHSR